MPSMQPTDWAGVLPAITTPFQSNGEVDHNFLTSHSQWLVGCGCTGIVALGSLGEGATLTREEKRAVLQTLVAAVGATVPVVAAISVLSTAEAVELAKEAESLGCRGLMVLPPYVYVGDWREMRAHVAAIFQATQLSCMLYNNPVAYKTDFVPEQIAELAGAFANFHAVKESTTDVRRVTAIRALTGDRLRILMGVDDAIVEGLQAGAVGWIAGLANAYPVESVKLVEYTLAGKTQQAFELYRWFLPMLRLDTVPKFPQLIKLVQAKAGMGTATVRAPRMEIAGAELDATLAIIAEAQRTRPALG